MRCYIYIFFVLLSACWNYEGHYPERKFSPLVLTQQAIDNNASDVDFYENAKKKWESDLSLQKKEVNLFGFDSPENIQLRKIASSTTLKETLQGEVSLPLLLCLSYERNPGLLEARKKVESKKERYTQAFFLQNLLDQYSSFTRSLNTKTGQQLHKVNVNQGTPFPGFFSIMSQIVTSDIEEEELRYAIALRNMINEITITYLELVYFREAIAIQKTHLEIVQSLENTARDKFRAGLTGYGDVLKTQILKAQITVDIQNYVTQEKTFHTQILAKLNLSEPFSLGGTVSILANPIASSLQEITSSAIQNRQEIQVVGVKAKKIQQLILLTKDKLYPDFTVGLSYFENRNDEKFSSQTSGFSDTINTMPRFTFAERNSYIREMQMQKEAADKEKENAEQNTRVFVHELYFEIDKHWREQLLYEKELIPLAEETLKVLRIAYQAGKNADFLDVLDAERTLLNLQLSMKKHHKNYLVAIANLEKVYGGKMRVP